MTSGYEIWIGLALEQAAGCAVSGDVPVGAVVVDAAGVVLSAARNARELSGDPTAHAEILALRAAAERVGEWRLDGCSLVVTLEPCPMCAGATIASRVSRLVYGAFNDELGAAGSQWDLLRDRRLNWRPEVVSGVRAAECSALLLDFFGEQRLSR